jgi:hypothetical protein
MAMSNIMWELLHGKMFTAINDLLTSKLGGLWYVIFFGVPWIMIWIKTESLALPTTFLLWTIAFYGGIINPDAMSSTIVFFCLSAGFALLLFKALSPLR